eukprot:9486132-Pyramimonas_sp.AAC.1
MKNIPREVFCNFRALGALTGPRDRQRNGSGRNTGPREQVETPRVDLTKKPRREAAPIRNTQHA